MKLRYLNGEKVYVDESCFLDINAKHDFWEDIQILKHNELIRSLNAMLEDAEKNPDDIDSDLTSLIYNLNCLCGKKENHKLKIETLQKGKTKFDNPHKVKISRQLTLHQEKRVKYCGTTPTVIKGGLYRPAEPGAVYDDLISDEYKVWRKAQNPEVTT